MIIQGKATPAILRDVLREQINAEDNYSLRDALVYVCNLLEKQDQTIENMREVMVIHLDQEAKEQKQIRETLSSSAESINTLFDYHTFDSEAIGNTHSAFVSEIRDLTDRTDRLDGALRRIDKRIQDLLKLVNELMWTPSGIAPTAPLPFAYRSTPEEDEGQGQAFVRNNPDPAALAAALRGRTPPAVHPF